MKKIDECPILFNGGIAVDDRGCLSYNNTVLEGIKRFYIVSNHKSHFVRAWHGHKKEAKYVTVLQGTAKIGLVKINNWKFPSNDSPIHTYTLSEHKPALLYIPTGYANGFMNLTKNTKIMFFSTSTLEESSGDDYRFDFDKWNIWKITPR